MPQSLCKNYIHLVFSTKERKDLIPVDLLEGFFHYIGGVVNGIGCKAIIVGGIENHVHILFELARTMALSNVVNKIKSNSSKWIRHEQGVFDFGWQDGYGAFSVGQSNVEVVRKYIMDQREHHQTEEDYQTEFRRYCQIYKINYDERYVWD
ncbi:MAG: IS200/IS605 family transposase [Bacteroidales bacterium]|nr:IS200/IS605 family transposase [Bacteroidales bacterium]